MESESYLTRAKFLALCALILTLLTGFFFMIDGGMSDFLGYLTAFAASLLAVLSMYCVVKHLRGDPR